jgi:hypothetical protein
MIASISRSSTARRWAFHDRVEFEVIDFAVELELHHPLDQLTCRHTGASGHLRMQAEQSPARVADDTAGVVGPRDHRDRGGKRLVPDGPHLTHLGGVGRGGCSFLQGVDRFVHPGPMLIRHVPPVQIGAASTDQRQHRIGENRHSDHSPQHPIEQCIPCHPARRCGWTIMSNLTFS